MTSPSGWRAQSHGLEAQLGSLGTVSELLKPTHDVSLDELPSRLQSVDTVRKYVARIDRLSASLRLPSESSEVRDRDWTDQRLKAEWTTQFLDQHAEHPPESLIRAATRPEIRQEMTDAVRRNLAAKSERVHRELGVPDPALRARSRGFNWDTGRSKPRFRPSMIGSSIVERMHISFRSG